MADRQRPDRGRIPPLVAPGPELTPTERSRYARHLILRDFGPEAQRRVRAATVLVIGAGGLGSPVLLYLAAAGVGRIVVVDDDVVDESNLHRQVIHGASTIGTPKAESAAARLGDLAELVRVDARTERLDPANVEALVTDCDVVVDGSDNFATRYLVADACEAAGRPLVWGTLDRYRAQFSVFWSAPPEGVEPVGLRDVYPEPPAPGTVPSCGEAGILGALTGQVGSLLALQALWLITGVGEPVLGRLVLVDSLATTQRSLRVHPDPNRPRVTSVAATLPETSCALPPVTGADPGGAAVREISVAETAERLGAAPGASGAGDSGTDASTPDASSADTPGAGAAGIVLLDVREAGERAVATIEPSMWVPLGEVGEALADPTSALSRVLGGGADLVVYCKAGSRSARAAAEISGHTDPARVWSMAGGIDAWSESIDPSLPRY